MRIGRHGLKPLNFTGSVIDGPAYSVWVGEMLRGIYENDCGFMCAIHLLLCCFILGF